MEKNLILELKINISKSKGIANDRFTVKRQNPPETNNTGTFYRNLPLFLCSTKLN